MPLVFHAGDAATAKSALTAAAVDATAEATAGGCLVSHGFARVNRLGPGDALPIALPGGGQRRYRIAGVIDSPGWLFAFQHNKTRRINTDHEVLVVLDSAVMRRDFPMPYANFLIGDTFAADGTATRYRRHLTPDGALQAEMPERLDLERAIASRIDLRRPLLHRPDGDAEIAADHRIVRISDNDELRFALDTYWGANGVKNMGLIPLTILGLSLLSLSGTLAASLRARAREMGVLRSCGLTRFGLTRLVVGESLLIGLAAILVGTAAGAAAAWLLCRITTLVGYGWWVALSPELSMPWSWFWPGVALTLVICLLAAVWAAWRIGRIPPATLAAGGPRAS